MDLSWAAAGTLVAVVAFAVLLASLRWWPRRRDRATLLAVVASLNVALLAALLSAVFLLLDEPRSGALGVAAAAAFVAYLTWRATAYVLEPVPLDAPGVGRIVPRALVAGLACGMLALVGLCVLLALHGEGEAIFFIVTYGAVVAAIVGGAAGLVLGLADALAVRLLTRAAR